MKKLNLILTVLLIVALASGAFAQKVIKKTVTKVVTPQITPIEPPNESSADVVEEVPPPPPPPTFEVQAIKEDKGLFGWGLNSDFGGKLLYGSILFGLRGDLIFSDPLLLGDKIGLAEDAVEYKVGLGLTISDKLNSLPLFMDTVVYLKEGSLFGMDPYVGAGLIFNLFGSNNTSGGLGYQLYTGILADFGFESRTGLNLGYATYKVGSDLTDSGIFFSVMQPIKL